MKETVIIRQAEETDRQQIERFLKRRIPQHRHLDWRNPTDWIGSSEFLLYLSADQSIEAILICTPELENIYWIRLFAYRNPFQGITYWNSLFNKVLNNISKHKKKPTIASLAYQGWMIDLLELEGWSEIQRVIQFEWNFRKKKDLFAIKESVINIRPMTIDDINSVSSIDSLCFDPLWQHSSQALIHAFKQASYTSVYEIKNQVIGFQISTYKKRKAHLARIAVLPEHQHQHIGKRLLIDMIKHFHKRGINDISVNTQKDNLKSIGLYKKLNFIETGSSYPIFQYK